jgi:DNA-binding NarL/FixJ family response regulator
MQLESGEQIRGVIHADDADISCFTGWHEFVGTLERLRAALPPPADSSPDHGAAAIPRHSCGDELDTTSSLNPALSDLSERERSVLALIAQGCSNDAIADRLSLSPKTISSHIRKLFRKLDIPTGRGHNRRVLATFVYLRDTADPASRL